MDCPGLPPCGGAGTIPGIHMGAAPGAGGCCTGKPIGAAPGGMAYIAAYWP